MSDQQHPGKYGTVFDGDLDPVPEIRQAGDLVANGSGLDDAIALVAACRDGRAALFAHEVEVMRSGTPRVMSTLVALSRMAAFYLECAAIYSDRSADELLQDFALRHNARRIHPSAGSAD